jgi:pyruvate/2-oxoglutarate/acetoin dehydrogenase E1 component
MPSYIVAQQKKKKKATTTLLPSPFSLRNNKIKREGDDVTVVTFFVTLRCNVAP